MADKNSGHKLEPARVDLTEFYCLNKTRKEYRHGRGLRAQKSSFFRFRIRLVRPARQQKNNSRVKVAQSATWPISHRSWTVQEGGIEIFFLQDLLMGLALGAKTCPHRPQAFKKVNNGQVFPLGNKHFVFCFPSKRAECRYSTACLKKISRKYSKSDCVGPISSCILCPKSTPYLN